MSVASGLGPALGRLCDRPRRRHRGRGGRGGSALVGRARHSLAAVEDDGAAMIAAFALTAYLLLGDAVSL